MRIFLLIAFLSGTTVLAFAQQAAQLDQWNDQALEAQLQYNLPVAKAFYKRSIAAPDSSQSLNEEQAKAHKGLRDIAMLEEQFELALAHHQRYEELLKAAQPLAYGRLRPQLDKVKARCQQGMGHSQAALQTLSTYAFGADAQAGGLLDKEMVDHLAELLLSKYPRKAIRKLIPQIQDQVRMEMVDGKARFFLKFYEDKIYFSNNFRNYEETVANGTALPGEAIAYYQRKLCNSYFFLQLVKNT